MRAEIWTGLRIEVRVVHIVAHAVIEKWGYRFGPGEMLCVRWFKSWRLSLGAETWTRAEQDSLHVTREWEHRSGRVDVCAIFDSGPIHDTNHDREMRMMIWTAAVQASVVHIVAQMVIGKWRLRFGPGEKVMIRQLVHFVTLIVIGKWRQWFGPDARLVTEVWSRSLHLLL